MKVDNIKLEKIVSSSPFVVLASGRLRFLNLDFDTGHLSFEMSCTFTVQVQAQLDLLWKFVEDQGLQERGPALAKRTRCESEKLHFPALGAELSAI